MQYCIVETLENEWIFNLELWVKIDVNSGETVVVRCLVLQCLILLLLQCSLHWDFSSLPSR